MRLVLGFTVWLVFLSYTVYSTGCTTFHGIGTFHQDGAKPVQFGNYKCLETSKDIHCSKP